MHRSLRRLIDDRSGVTAIEYAVLTTLVSVAIIVSVSLTGANLNDTYGTIATALGAPLPDHHHHD